ncbi:hypothetical protein AOQ84DRAFT_356111 [Glonium stellatum]|uniref:Uncharacterized protein n=1 Tax=Glonium stellatum TaxID=574774 RepID=A0A8E2JPZ7_9PEZI|nr:hypothetical protein AOQ84DRAFT_356111 [Glonium stellatum]
MRLQVFTAALLSSSALASSPNQRRQTTDAQEFSSAAGQLISLYIPASVQSAIASAASQASVTGDPQSIVNSALTATVTPSWFTAIPTEYQPNINSLESAISDLRGAAATGIPGAPRVTTATDSAGSTYVTTIPGSMSITGSVAASLSSVISSLESSASAAASSALSSESSALSSLEASASAAISSASVAASHTVSSSKSSGFAAPTQVPMAAAGVLGFLGLVLAI